MPAEVSEGSDARTKAAAPTPPVPPTPTPHDDPLLTSLHAAPVPGVLPPRCLNCETPLTGPYCAQCGQHVADYHRSVGRLIGGFFNNVFNWDSKVFRTLKPLITRPGLLTREFLVGRRARYVHPLRLFLFTSAVCLTLLQFGHHRVIKASADPKKNAAAGSGTVHFNMKDAEDDDDDSPSPTPAAPSPSPVAASPSPAAPGSPAVSPSPGSSAHAPKKPEEANNAFERYMEDFGKRFEERTKQLGQAEVNRQVSAKMQSSLSWVALAILPVFALLLRSAYWRRDSFYFDHLIYSLHYHTFLLLLMTTYRVIDGSIYSLHLSWLKVPLACGLLVPPWYLYRSLRFLFGESRVRTAVKVGAIGGLHLIALVIGMAIVGMTSVFSMV